jgi:hypothetical protein
MSGTGPSNNETPSGGGTFNPPDCINLTGRGTIMSPDPAILPLLNGGDIVTISLRSVAGPLQAYTLEGQLIGNIFLPGNLSATFIACISDTNDYQGKITSLSGGLCELFIRLK